MDKLEQCDWSCDKIKKYWKNQKYNFVKNTPFTDPYFPPDENSLLGKTSEGEWIDTDGPKYSQSINSSKLEWKRATEIFADFSLFEDKIECDDIKQGNLGNCYFLSSIAALTEYSEFIFKIFRTKHANREGYYEVTLYIDGEWQIVTVDDYFPVIKGTNEFRFAKPNGNELWVILLEGLLPHSRNRHCVRQRRPVRDDAS